MEIKKEHKELLKSLGLNEGDFDVFDGKYVTYEYDEHKGVRLYDPLYRTSYNEYIDVDGWSAWSGIVGPRIAIARVRGDHVVSLDSAGHGGVPLRHCGGFRTVVWPGSGAVDIRMCSPGPGEAVVSEWSCELAPVEGASLPGNMSTN